jgi:hypothetical protein
VRRSVWGPSAKKPLHSTATTPDCVEPSMKRSTGGCYDMFATGLRQVCNRVQQEMAEQAGGE